MAIVFLMLILLCLIVSAFKYLPKKEEKKETVVKPQPVVSAPQKAFTMDDIKDEDMMVAALVATIDYHNETKEDVRVVSVKQIGQEKKIMKVNKVNVNGKVYEVE